VATVSTPRSAAATSADLVRQRLRGGRLDVTGRAFEVVLLVSLLASLAILVVLVTDVVRGGAPVFSERAGDFLTSGISSNPDTAGVWQGVRGTLTIAAFVIVIAFPMGIAAALYMEEYAPDNRLCRFSDVNIRNLAGVPSIVYGLLGFAIFVRALDGLTGGRTVIAAGLTLAVLVLPIVIITSAEAVRAVPGSLREAGFGVGATHWEVIRHHVLPYAAPGILTGTVLSLARAMGEAAPLILVGAVTGFFSESGGFFDKLQGKFTALPMQVFQFARQPSGEFRNELGSATIVVLLVMILTINAAAILLRNRYERKRTG
jgi:phosphate transport system permease protein